MAELIGLIFGGLEVGTRAAEMGADAEKRKKDKEEKKTRIGKAKKVVGDVDDKISSLVKEITKEPKMPPVRRRKKEYSDKEKIQKTLKDTRQQLELLIKRL